MIAQIALSVLVCMAAASCSVAWLHLRASVRLADISAEGIEHWPRVSVIMPGRDEADRIASALRSRLADDYPDLELILVDDRSSDGTGDVAREVAAGDPRLTVVRVDELPSGWLGKVHALQAGVDVADGEYLLFSDADVAVERGAVRRAIVLCESRDVDCLAIVPEYRSASWFVDSTWTVFVRALFLALSPKGVANPGSKAAIGSGAFTLVRRSAYLRTAGIEHLRMDTADDMALASMIKASGGRNLGAIGKDCVSVRMYDSVTAFVRGIEKNGATTASQPLKSTAGLLAFACIDFAPLIAIAVGPTWLRILGIAAALVQWTANVAIFHATCRLWAPALLWPLGTLLFEFGVLRSTWLAVIRRGVWWRGTFYSLAELEAGRRYTL